MSTTASKGPPEKVNPLYDPRLRGIAYQAILVLVVAWLGYMAVANAIENLRAAKIASGFGFLDATASFDISMSLIPYSATSTYGRAFLVGLLNTLLVAAIGIVLSTILGFLIGVARLSQNWIVARLATVYVEVVRNVPLLLQLLFWYIAVLRALPEPRNSLGLGLGTYLNNRGLYVPRPLLEGGAWLILAALLAGIVGAVLYARAARREQAATGRQSWVGLVGTALVIGLPAFAWIAVTAVAGNPIAFELPTQTRFNLVGGLPVLPEFVALTIGLSIYTAAFIAEIVRAGILAVSKGQTEAAGGLGLRPGQTLRLIVIPQALQVIIPPLTSSYLNVTKNSSLAVVIGYPDLVQVVMGTMLNQTGQAIECVAITMAVYLTISLLTSVFMNYYNARMALVER